MTLYNDFLFCFYTLIDYGEGWENGVREIKAEQSEGRDEKVDFKYGYIILDWFSFLLFVEADWWERGERGEGRN